MRKFYLIIIFLCFFSCSTLTYNPLTNHYTSSAGYYFPSDKKQLEDTISKYLNSFEKDTTFDNNIFGIIAPHAGYNYSGVVAGAVYKQLSGAENKTAIVISNNHH
ncbi:MAG: AmmeMemoRadiSam system protein B, partial [Elusimicrobiales bacterium]|nr:AmmeMemoRadiSam system protein B [Elusimicrobiales bacterium]